MNPFPISLVPHPLFTVTHRALLRRVNRRLAHRRRVMRTSTGWREIATLGHFCILSLDDGSVLDQGIGDLTAFARELGVMGVWESVVGQGVS